MSETYCWALSTSAAAEPCGGLWCFPLDLPDADTAALAALLDDTERARAARFRFPEHRRRFTVAHGRLRQALASLLGTAPAALQFSSAVHGKPGLAQAHEGAGLQFNLSHSGGWGLIGWAWHRQIGVDIELWRTMTDEAALVRRFFSPAEVEAYETLEAARRSAGFFHAWTRKEAYVKAVGRGLGLALDSFDVSLEEGAGARLLRPSSLCDDGLTWALAAPAGVPGASLAVVLQADHLFVAPIPGAHGFLQVETARRNPISG